jgi:hypothetical protein
MHAQLEHRVPQHFRAHAVRDEVHRADVCDGGDLLKEAR